MVTDVASDRSTILRSQNAGVPKYLGKTIFVLLIKNRPYSRYSIHVCELFKQLPGKIESWGEFFFITLNKTFTIKDN